jgi:hypothetical protein
MPTGQSTNTLAESYNCLILCSHDNNYILLATNFLLVSLFSSFFDPKNGDNMILRVVGLLPN